MATTKKSQGQQTKLEKQMKIRKATIKDAEKIRNLIKNNLFNAPINKYALEQKKGILEKNPISMIKNKIKRFNVFCAFEKNIKSFYFILNH